MFALIVSMFLMMFTTTGVALAGEDPIEEAKATLEARLSEAREKRKLEMTAVVTEQEVKFAAANSGCAAAKTQFINGFVMKGRVEVELRDLPMTDALDPDALAEHKKVLEDILNDAEAQIAASTAKAASFGAERVAAKAALESARTELERLKRMEDAMSGARLPLSSGSLGMGYGGGSSSTALDLVSTTRLTVPLPAEFVGCGFPSSIEVRVASASSLP